MKLTASKIPADPAGSGWYELLPPPPGANVLDQDLTTDWIIIGAGFAGLSAAWQLAEKCPDSSVAVLDAQRIAWGAAGRNSGFFIDLPHNLQSQAYVGDDSSDRKHIQFNRFAIEFAKARAEQCEITEHLSHCGRINAATDNAGLKALQAYSRHLENLGEPFTRYDNDDLKRVTGTDYYNGGIHMPGCLLIQPVAYIRGLAENLPNNVTVYENSPVVSIETGDTCKVTTPKGSVTGAKIILTVNGHIESFGLYQRRLMHVFLYGSMTRELTDKQSRELGGDPEWGITPAHPMGSTVRRLRENRIIVRNHITYNPERETSQKLIQRSRNRHIDSFRNRFPMLKDVELEYTWSGHLCMARNSVPIFGEIEKNLFAACCQNGVGATHGTYSGVFIVDHALGDNHDMVQDILGHDLPKKLFPEPFMSIGAKTHLWWGQKQASKDI